jgi:uncharacterized protein (TIGR02001 family)
MKLELTRPTAIGAALTVALFTSSTALAQPKPQPLAKPQPLDLTTTVTVMSDYRFRGVSRTFGDPSVQGGVQAEFNNNFYAGAKAALVDKQVLADSKGIELQVYGGYRWEMDNGLKFDAGGIHYVYPGKTSLATLEAYIGVSWEFLAFKYSHSLSNRFFGVPGARGSTYYDLTAEYPVGPDLTAFAHYGIQRFRRNPGDYSDYSFGIRKRWYNADWQVGIFGTDTRILGTNVGGRQKNLGARRFVLSVSKDL